MLQNRLSPSGPVISGDEPVFIKVDYSGTAVAGEATKTPSGQTGGEGFDLTGAVIKPLKSGWYFVQTKATCTSASASALAITLRKTPSDTVDGITINPTGTVRSNVTNVPVAVYLDKDVGFYLTASVPGGSPDVTFGAAVSVWEA